MKSARPASIFHSSSRGAMLGCLLLLCSAPIASPAQNLGQNPALNPAQNPALTIDPSQQVIEHVHGVVLNAIDKKPIARALVSSGDQRMATMTDSDGRFSFDIRRLPANTASTSGVSPLMNTLRGYRMPVFLLVRRPGYLNLNQQAQIPADSQSSIDEIQVKLVPEAILSGHLSVSNSAKPSNIQVQLHHKQVQDGAATWVPAGAVQANSHGDYSFADLQAGDYKLMSMAWSERGFRGAGSDEAFGYAPAYFGDSADLASSPTIHLAAGQTAEANLNLRASTFYHVTIPVANVAKDGGINVIVGNQQDQSGLVLSFNSQTQMADGFLPNGTYDIRALTFGPQPSSGTGRVEVAGKPVKASPITLAPTSPISVIVHEEFTASNTNQPSGPSAALLAQLAQRRPLNITLRPVDQEGPWAGLGNQTSRDNQNLILENVQQGAYHVLATPTHGYVAAMSANGVDLLRQPLVVGPGGAAGPIEITLRDDSATLTGTISSPSTSANPIDPDTIFAVLCIPLDTSSATPMTSIAQGGKFTVRGLAPGEYLVLAMGMAPNNSIPNNIEYQNPDVLREYQTKGTTVTLSAGQKAEIQVPVLSNPGEDN